MIDKVRTIRLYGVLGARFGRVHRLAVSSTGEAVRALCVLVPGFEAFLSDARSQGFTFSVFIGRENITKEQVNFPVGDDDIRIAPIIIGSKNGGVFQTIMGAVLIAAGVVGNVFFPGNPVSPFLINAGIAMVIGGVIQMLSPSPKGLASSDDADNRPNYNFNGPVNTSAQGGCVGLMYGEGIIGSAVISAGVFAEDQTL